MKQALDTLPAPRPGKLNNLQLLRAVAALIVVVAHAIHEVSEAMAREGFIFAPPTISGPFGVELFFVISGFIIVFISYDRFRDPGHVPHFVVHRLVRIVPMYWLFTLLWIGLALVVGGDMTHPDLGWSKIWSSFLFIPLSDGAKGYVPLYALGWSLNFEMLFYLIFALALLFSRLKGMIFLTLLLVAIFVLARVVQLPTIEFYGAYYFLLEFLAGAWLAYFVRSSGRRIPAGVFLPSLLLLGVLITLQIVAARDASAEPWTMVFRALAAVTIVTTFVLCRDVDGRNPLSRLLIAIGDSSYSLYLVHPFVLGALVLLAGKLNLVQSWMPWPLVLVCIGLSVAAGWIAHHLLEKPLLRAGQGLARRLTTRVPPAVSTQP